MSRRNIFEKQESDLSKRSMQRQSTTKNLKGQKSFFSNLSKTMFKGQNNQEEDEILFLCKGIDNCIRILIYLLINYDGMEQYLKRQTVLSPLNSYPPIKTAYEDLSPIRCELIYYFQIISIRDFHDFYVDFYATFDKNKNFSLEPSEFKQLIEVAVNKCVGPKKFKIITDICLNDPSLYDNQLDQKIMAEMIENFRDLDKEQRIDYLLLFPYILSFFLEFTYSQIKYRQGRLDLMRGTEIIKGKEVEIKNITSIVTILKEMGIEYVKEKRTVCLTYRDVENLLIKLKNIHKWITFDIIKQIISQLAKLMQVDPKTQNEGKPLKLHKIVNFLALKLCIHQNCLQLSKQDKEKQKPPSAYLEILVLWNAAMYGQIMKKQTLETQFQTFLDKHYRDQEQFLRPDAQKMLEHFFKKKFQLMPKDHIKNILEQHPDIQQQLKSRKVISAPISKTSLKEEIFQMMCKDGYRKVKEYIRISYEGVNKSNAARIQQYQRQGKDFYEDIQINSPPSSENKPKSPVFDYQSERLKKNHAQQSVKDKEADDESESQESEQGDRKKPKDKLKRAVRVINSEIAFSQKAESKKDVLKACLIMDSFLKRQNQMYQKIQQSKIIQGSQINENNQKIQEEEIKFDEQVELLQKGMSSEVQERKESKKKPEEKKKQEEVIDQEPEGIDQKKTKALVPQRPKIIIKDIKSQQSALFMVAGKEGKNYGPSNFKNAYYQNNNSAQQVAKLMNLNTSNKPQLFQLTDDDFKNEEGKFQVVIDDVQLQTQILIQQNIAKSKKPKDRSTCYYCSVQ